MLMSPDTIREFRWKLKEFLILGVMFTLSGILNSALGMLFYFSSDQLFSHDSHAWLFTLIGLLSLIVGVIYIWTYSKGFYIRVTGEEIIISPRGLCRTKRIKWDNIERIVKFGNHGTTVLLTSGKKTKIAYWGLHYPEKGALRKILSDKLGEPLPPGPS